MTPADICIRQIDCASTLTDTTVIERVDAALDLLMASYSSPTEKILALERVHSAFFRRRRSVRGTPFGCFVMRNLDRRQTMIIKTAA